MPLDSDHPPARLAGMLADLDSPLIVTTEALAEQCELERQHCLRLDQLGAEIAAQEATNLDRRVELEDVAYIIFTSGSTGRPKASR